MNFLVIRYGQMCRMAHNATKHSFSVVLYRVSGLLSAREKYAIGWSNPSFSWLSTAPIATSDASVVSVNVFSKSGKISIGCFTKQFFNISKLFCCSECIIGYKTSVISEKSERLPNVSNVLRRAVVCYSPNLFWIRFNAILCYNMSQKCNFRS